MEKEKISVIVPVYNLAQYLPRCLDSILAQTYENIELILVDDGSRDDSLAVMEQYAARDSRVKAIHKGNGGVTSARLRGLQEATGQWIGFIDGDDEIDPQMYGRLLENARKYDADISHCGYQRNFTDGRVEYHCNSGVIRPQDHLTALRDLLEEQLVEPGLCSKLYRASLFPGLTEKMEPGIRYNEDLLMNYYLFSQAERSVYEDVCPYHYMVRGDSVSQRGISEARLFDPIRVREIILADCGEELKDDARQAQLRALLYIYALLTVESAPEYADHKNTVRGKIVALKNFYWVLSRRNRVLAGLICYAPWLFHFAFKTYVKLCLGGHYQ